MHVGPAAIVNGATSLVNGSILSCPEAPTLVGPGVQAESFIIAEGARVTGGALLAKTYVGQGSQVGRQFSAEGSLLFANCEAFHGEACSVFAGPYTVTHHKGTLLIAGLFSFYNAGSSTNQSNHMYKLGPVHEGRVERGSKTGSFSYMMWPCRVGPFCVVLGKHTRAFDTADFPFSHIEALPDGRCSLIPGFNLTTVGTVRDGAKWPTRDRRKGPVKRDRLSFDVFSPYTVGRMLRGMDILHDFQQKTDRSVTAVPIGGAEVKRVFLRTGLKFYRRGSLMYLTEKIVARLERVPAGGPGLVDRGHGSAPDAVFSAQWVDVGGQLMPSARLESLVEAVENGSIADLAAFFAQLDQIQAAYAEDEWVVDQVGLSATDGSRSGAAGARSRSWKSPTHCWPPARNSSRPCWPTPSRNSTDTARSDLERTDHPRRSTRTSRPCAATTTRTSSSSRCRRKSNNSRGAWTSSKNVPRVALSRSRGASKSPATRNASTNKESSACPISLIASRR